MHDFFLNIINGIGISGPIILFICSIYLLYKKKTLLMYYLYGYFLNLLLNLVLKGMIKQPRPLDDPELFKLALKHSIRFRFINGFPYDSFGMPSGHSQAIFYTVFFIYLALRDIYVTLFFISIALLTAYQRVLFNDHTILQVIVGIVVGILFAFLIYYMSQNQIMGKIRMKKDDNAYSTF
jgi:membrane-associated phospholipid phosphatase